MGKGFLGKARLMGGARASEFEVGPTPLNLHKPQAREQLQNPEFLKNEGVSFYKMRELQRAVICYSELPVFF